jgi:PleD family two-component response regulator
MVLAVIDDLMLQSRVSAAAKASGAQISFAGSEETAFARAAEGPGLILVDLNGRRTNPIPFVVRLKADAALSKIRVLGFVSHVDAKTIAEARAAGIDEVLARGAFINQLPAILAAEPSRLPGDAS